MAGAALKLALLYVIVLYVDQSLLSWQCMTRPIVIAPLAGLVVGDFHTGIVMGASLEAAFMGISAIGGAVAADATVASIIAVAYAVLTNAGIEEGIAISVPIGTLMASISAMFTPLWAGFAAFFEKLAAECNPKKFLVVNLLIGFVQLSINATILFLAVAFGIDGLQNFLASMPAWVMTGLGAASGMMLAVGFAILTSMIWNPEVCVWFFVGYVLVAYGVITNTLALAVVGAAIAVTLFFAEKRTIDLKNSGVAAATPANSEEDFF